MAIRIPLCENDKVYQIAPSQHVATGAIVVRKTDGHLVLTPYTLKNGKDTGAGLSIPLTKLKAIVAAMEAEAGELPEQTEAPDVTPEELERFQATKVKAKDLGVVMPGMDLDQRPGLTYCDGRCYIEDWKDKQGPTPRGRWYTIIGNREYQSDNLTEIERVVCEWALDEEYLPRKR